MTDQQGPSGSSARKPAGDEFKERPGTYPQAEAVLYNDRTASSLPITGCGCGHGPGALQALAGLFFAWGLALHPTSSSRRALLTRISSLRIDAKKNRATRIKTDLYILCQVVTRRPINLSIAGPDWLGWSFGPYGKARSFRLTTPAGESLDAHEIQWARADKRDLDYLRNRIIQLNDALQRAQRPVTVQELKTLVDAQAILQKLLTTPRECSVTPLRPSPYHSTPTVKGVRYAPMNG